MDNYINVQQIENRTQIFAEIADKKRASSKKTIPSSLKTTK